MNKKKTLKVSLDKFPIAEIEKALKGTNYVKEAYLNDEDAWEMLKTRKSLYQLWNDAGWIFWGKSRKLDNGKIEFSHRASIMGIPITAYFLLDEADFERKGKDWEIINPDWEKSIFKIEIDQDRIKILGDVINKVSYKSAKNAENKVSKTVKERMERR